MIRQLCGASVALLMLTACDRVPTDNVSVEQGLDVALRDQIRVWGVMPIADVPTQNPAMVSLGQALFFDKLLSGNRDVSCATCHDVNAALTDGMSLAVGTGSVGTGSLRHPGVARQFVPRNAPTLLNSGLGLFYSLWDGRVSDQNFGALPSGGSAFTELGGVVLPAGLTNIIAAQAMLPVLNRVEMRGAPGDTDVFGKANELAAIDDTAAARVWSGVMARVLAIQEYAARFAAAYPGVPPTSLGFQHAANAIAAFQVKEFTRATSAFDRYLANDAQALTETEKRGALLFFTKARCVSCHSGPLLGGQNFENAGVPQIGPGMGAAAPLDLGRGGLSSQFQFYRFAFRVPTLRNVELTAPYMHDGAYRTLERVVQHYTNADSAQRAYDVTQLDPAVRSLYHGDAATMTDVLSNLSFTLRPRIPLDATERAQLVAFLKSLTDPAARDLSALVPSTVPSGLPVK
jgi:cytochrome c peroxidase